jgi:heme exporter protein D
MMFRLLGAGNDPMQWIAYGMGALVILYLVIRPLTKKKDPLDGVPKFSLSKQRTVEREMSNVLVELSDMARKVTGQLDTRSAKLEALMQEADQRIAELKRMMSAGGSGNGAAQEPPGREGPPPDPRYVEIYSLADAGRSASEIAQQLSRPRGEVELILALRVR